MRKVLVILLLVLVTQVVLAQNNFPIGYQEIKVSQPGMVPIYSRIHIAVWYGAELRTIPVTVDAYIQWFVPPRPDLDYQLKGDDGSLFIFGRQTLEGSSRSNAAS